MNLRNIKLEGLFGLSCPHPSGPSTEGADVKNRS